MDRRNFTPLLYQPSFVERLTFVEHFAIVERMEVTVSDKYQVVIPKEARKKLGIKPGQKITVASVGKDTITFKREPTMQELLDMGRGTMKNTPWQKEGIDPTVWLRRMRDEEDDQTNKLVGRE